MKSLIRMAGLVLIGHSVAHAEIRTFTDTEGRTVEAELVAVDDGEAVLRLPDRKIARVPLDSLAAADRDFARKWWEENRNRIDAMDVVVSIKKNSERIDRKVSRSGGGRQRDSSPVTRRMSKDRYFYTCQIQNYLPRDIEDISVSYTIHKRVSTVGKNGSETLTEEIDGDAVIRRLGALGTAEFETVAVDCENHSQTGGRGPREMRRESVRGVVFTFSAGGREFLSQSDPENLLERLEEERRREENR